MSSNYTLDKDLDDFNDSEFNYTFIKTLNSSTNTKTTNTKTQFNHQEDLYQKSIVFTKELVDKNCKVLNESILKQSQANEIFRLSYNESINIQFKFFWNEMVKFTKIHSWK